MQLHHRALLRLWSGLLCVLLPVQGARAECEGVKIETVRVAKAIAAGQSVDDVVKAGLIADLSGRYGKGVMDAEAFLRIVHASVSGS
jgi:hypothetical protein